MSSEPLYDRSSSSSPPPSPGERVCDVTAGIVVVNSDVIRVLVWLAVAHNVLEKEPKHTPYNVRLMHCAIVRRSTMYAVLKYCIIRTAPVLASCIQSNIREWSTVKSLSQTHGQCLAFFLLYRKCTHSQILVGLVTMREPSVHVHYIKHEFKAWSKRKRFNSVHSFMRF